MRLAAIVLAAGKSTRLPRFKALLPLGGQTLVGRAASLFRQAGVREVVAVTGCRADEVEAEARAHGMRPVFNPCYQDGMFTSVQAGLAAVRRIADGAFILPVDIPLIRPATIAALVERCGKSDALVLRPSFRGEAGHPPLIRAEAFAAVLAWKGENGLEGALAQVPGENMPVADAQILADVDDDAAFALAEDRVARLDIPTVQEALALLDIYDAGERGHAHGRGVADAALALARALQARGIALDVELIESAALLHDIAKGQRDHEKAGAKLLSDLGFARVADIVAAHRDIDPAGLSRPAERELVYLADKLVRGPQPLPVSQRFQEKLDRYAHDPEATRAIRRRLANALAMQTLVETCAGQSVQEILHTSRETGQ